MAKYEPASWPPALGREFPDLGTPRPRGACGPPIGIGGAKSFCWEPIGMDCPACQGFFWRQRFGGLWRGGGPEECLGARKAAGRLGWRSRAGRSRSGLCPAHPLRPATGDHPRPVMPPCGTTTSESPSVTDMYSYPKATCATEPASPLIPGFQLIDRDFVPAIRCVGAIGQPTATTSCWGRSTACSLAAYSLGSADISRSTPIRRPIHGGTSALPA